MRRSDIGVCLIPAVLGLPPEEMRLKEDFRPAIRQNRDPALLTHDGGRLGSSIESSGRRWWCRAASARPPSRRNRGSFPNSVRDGEIALRAPPVAAIVVVDAPPNALIIGL